MEKKEKWSVLLIAALTAVFLTSCSTPTKQQKGFHYTGFLPISQIKNIKVLL